MFTIFGLQKTDPIWFVTKLDSKPGVEYMLSPVKVSDVPKNRGKRIICIFLELTSCLNFIRSIATTKSLHTILLFAPLKQLDEIGAKVLDKRSISFEGLLALINNNPNTTSPIAVPSIKKDADIFELIEKSKNSNSYLQKFNTLCYSFQHALRLDIKNAVVQFMCGVIDVTSFKNVMMSRAPKHAAALERYKGLIDLTLSDIGLTLKKAVSEAIRSKDREKQVRLSALKYQLPRFDIRYFVTLYMKNQNMNIEGGKLLNKNKNPSTL
jgi:hypothetical protein